MDAGGVARAFRGERPAEKTDNRAVRTFTPRDLVRFGELRCGAGRRTHQGKIQNVLDYIWKKIQLSLPPLAEQRAIVAKVEELFAVFDAMKGEAAK